MPRKFRKHAAIAASFAQSGIEDPNFLKPMSLELFGQVEERLGYEFKDRDLLARSFTHRSARELTSCGDYERLEFLGDSVLELTVAHLLSQKHESASEGELSKMRAALVSEGSLAEIARCLELGRFVRLSWVEQENGGSDRASILSDVVEAVIGAVYLEAGFEVVLGVVGRVFGDKINSVSTVDPKTDLQEIFHARKQGNPVYNLEATEGPEHSPIFVSSVAINGEVLGRGRGKTKKVSQQAAALEALNRLLEQQRDEAPAVEVASKESANVDLNEGISISEDVNDKQQ